MSASLGKVKPGRLSGSQRPFQTGEYPAAGSLAPAPPHPSQSLPVRVLLQGLHGLGDISGVPELDLAVVPAAGEVVLLVGVEVQVPHQLPVGVLYAVDLTAGESGGRTRNATRAQKLHSQTRTASRSPREDQSPGTAGPATGLQAGAPRSAPLPAEPRPRLPQEHTCDSPRAEEGTLVHNCHKGDLAPREQERVRGAVPALRSGDRLRREESRPSSERTQREKRKRSAAEREHHGAGGGRHRHGHGRKNWKSIKSSEGDRACCGWAVPHPLTAPRGTDAGGTSTTAQCNTGDTGRFSLRSRGTRTHTHPYTQTRVHPHMGTHLHTRASTVCVH